MKKLTNYFLCWILAISLLLTVAATMVFAVDNALQSTATQVTGEDTFTVSFTQPTDITVASLSLDISFDNNAFEIVSIENAPYANIQPGIEGCNFDGVVSIAYTDPTYGANTQIVKGTVLLAATFKIKDGASAGPKSFSVQQYYLEGGTEDEYGGFQDITPDYGNSTLTVSIVESSGNETTDDYIVTVENPSDDLVTKDSQFTVNVNVNNAYNSAKIELSYESAYLEVIGCAVADNDTETCSFDTTNAGTIVILDYGAENATDVDYTITFKANKATKDGTSVRVVSAGISTAEKAAAEDLTPVDENNLSTASIPVGYTVTLPTGDHTFNASTVTVLPEGTVTITANNPYYDYELTADNATLTENQDGTWTLSGLTDNTTITVGTATAKKFDVTVKIVDTDGSEIPEDENNKITEKGATYNENFTYTWPNNTPAGVSAGVQYTLKSITVGGSTVACSTTDRITTIEGANVTGDIVITVTREDLDPNAFTVRMDGDSSVGSLKATQVESGGNAVLTLDESKMLEGYIYSVTATMGGQSVDLVQNGNVYTVSSVIGNVVFIINKSLDTESLVVSEYLSLSGQNMWLIKINGLTNTTNKTYTYTIDENNTVDLFWSEQYKAYCYLIISASETADDVKKDLGSFALATDRAAKVIDYSGNVNMTTDGDGNAVIDVNDAQLVWNMYNAQYDNFTDAVTVEKFLRADVETNGVIDVDDAAAVITIIQAPTAGN